MSGLLLGSNPQIVEFEWPQKVACYICHVNATKIVLLMAKEYYNVSYPYKLNHVVNVKTLIFRNISI